MKIKSFLTQVIYAAILFNLAWMVGEIYYRRYVNHQIPSQVPDIYVTILLIIDLLVIFWAIGFYLKKNKSKFYGSRPLLK